MEEDEKEKRTNVNSAEKQSVRRVESDQKSEDDEMEKKSCGVA